VKQEGMKKKYKREEKNNNSKFTPVYYKLEGRGFDFR
jgi:hypothetical protein